MKSATLQQAVYTQLNNVALTALLTTSYAPLVPIFSDVPDAADGQPDNGFPYVIIGNDTITEFATKDKVGGNALVQVDAYSRSTSKLEIKTIADAVDARLRRQALTITGATHITTELESATITRDEDGRTMRALLIYRVIWLNT
jgi:hypothetical protein